PENLFAVLDPYEGFNPEDSVNSLYVREEIEVFLDINKNPIKAWGYVFNKPADLYRRIESGNFMDFAEAGE
ncbi:MAG: gamma-glutamylcyclotransferase, partial [Spirosomaceae bacterium]|nr:gamma-glutamylcyclotransferase [Spirosomataceae bacterium]